MITIIIGGGASGLVSAINAKCPNNDVIILERNNSCGKKILVTGNGHCNYFHTDITSTNYHSFSPLDDLITKENITNTLNFLNNIGIVPKIKNGYYYPYSNQAVSVVNALMNEVTKRGIKVITNTFVTNLRKEKDTFIVTTNNGEFTCDNVVISVGGSAYPKSGSDGNFYNILKDLGHKIVKPLPALVGLTVQNNIKELKGVRTDALVTLYEDGQELRKEEGEVQHNENGISGICVMQLSSEAVRGLEENKQEEIHINYVKDIASNKNKFYSFLEKHDKNSKISSILDQVLNYKLTNYFLKSLNMKDEKIQKLEKDKLLSLCEMITNFKLIINGNNGFNLAQVTSGGVSLDEVNHLTLESKLISNLYFSGEILDVTGDCGGYNLAFAFLSGIIAGKSIRGKLNDQN